MPSNFNLTKSQAGGKIDSAAVRFVPVASTRTLGAKLPEDYTYSYPSAKQLLGQQV